MEETLKQLLLYAEKEFSLLTDIEESNKQELKKIAMDFLTSSCTLAEGDRTYMLKQVQLLERLVKKLPLSNITESDFELVDVESSANNTVKMLRCSRYQYLWKTSDGQYVDDRAKVWISRSTGDYQYRYTGLDSSTKFVTIPYYPNEHKIYVDSLV